VAGISAAGGGGLSNDPHSEESVKLDSKLLKITVFYMLAPMMAALDIVVVNVAQRTFVHRADSVLAEAARRGVMPDPPKLPHQVFALDFTEHVTKDLSRAYAVVFEVATIPVATTFIPVWSLPKKPAANPRRMQQGTESPSDAET
jgi:hypothetical protein